MINELQKNNTNKQTIITELPAEIKTEYFKDGTKGENFSITYEEWVINEASGKKTGTMYVETYAVFGHEKKIVRIKKTTPITDLTDEEKEKAKNEAQGDLNAFVATAFKAVQLSGSVVGSRNPSGVFQDVIEDIISGTGLYDPGGMDNDTATTAAEKFNKVLTVVMNIGRIVAILILAILGIKYMLGSVEEKAEYKKDLVPYLIGAILVFGILSLLKIFVEWGQAFNL